MLIIAAQGAISELPKAMDEMDIDYRSSRMTASSAVALASICPPVPHIGLGVADPPTVLQHAAGRVDRAPAPGRRYVTESWVVVNVVPGSSTVRKASPVACPRASRSRRRGPSP